MKKRVAYGFLVLYSIFFVLMDLAQGQPTTFVNPDFYFDLS